MKKSIILLCICAITLMLSSCGKNSGTSHLTQEEKLMKKHVMAHLEEKVKSYNTVVIEYADRTSEHFRHALLEDLPCPSCRQIIKVVYSYGEKYNENVGVIYLEYDYWSSTKKLFMFPLDTKYYWILDEGMAEWKLLWMEDK